MNRSGMIYGGSSGNDTDGRNLDQLKFMETLERKIKEDRMAILDTGSGC